MSKSAEISLMVEDLKRKCCRRSAKGCLCLACEAVNKAANVYAQDRVGRELLFRANRAHKPVAKVILNWCQLPITTPKKPIQFNLT